MPNPRRLLLFALPLVPAGCVTGGSRLYTGGLPSVTLPPDRPGWTG